jgi:lysozyme family protein
MAAPWTFDESRAGYGNLWRSATLKGGSDLSNANSFANKIIAAEEKYKAVHAQIGVPWFFIGALHMRESSCNFSTHLHNGDTLNARTTHVPAGRPTDGSPPFTWEESAIDALKLKSLHRVPSWPVERMLYHAEEFNGWGYAYKRVNSPYVWAGTNHEQSGKYIADHVWDANANDSQLGVAAVLIRLAEMRPDIKAALASQAPAEVIPPSGLPATIEERLAAIFQNIDARLARLEKALPSLPTLPAPDIQEPPKNPPPLDTGKPKPGVGTDLIASLAALFGGVIAQGTGYVGMPVGDAGTTGGFLTTVLPIAATVLTGLTGSNMLGGIFGSLMNGLAGWAANRTRK